MSDTYNPILTQEELRRGLFQPRPVPDPQTALVFSGEGEHPLIIMQGQRSVTRGEIVYGKYNQVYKVDITEHPLSFRCDLPCKTDAFNFDANVKFNCSVRDPEMIVRRNVTDVSRVLEPLIVEVMRSMSREYELEDSGKAEGEIGDRVKKAIYDQGFNLSQFTLTLFLEPEARERIREKKRIEEEIKLEKVRQDLENQKAQREIDVARQREELEREQIRQRNEFNREEQKTQLHAEIELQKIRQDLELQKKQFEIYQQRQQEQLYFELTKQKVEFFTAMLPDGESKLLALQIAQNPQSVQFILEEIKQQQQNERDEKIKMLKMLLDAGALENWQLTEVGKRALQQVIGFTEQSTPVLEASSINKVESQNVVPKVDITDNETSEDKTPEEWRREK